MQLTWTRAARLKEHGLTGDEANTPVLDYAQVNRGTDAPIRVAPSLSATFEEHECLPFSSRPNQ